MSQHPEAAEWLPARDAQLGRGARNLALPLGAGHHLHAQHRLPLLRRPRRSAGLGAERRTRAGLASAGLSQAPSALFRVFVGPQTAFGWIGLVPLLTGIFGFCPLYKLLGVSTCPLK